jgi:hypothetical protein
MESHLIVPVFLALLSQPALSSTHLASQNAERPPRGGIIAGVVVDERQEPVARAMVQAFPAETTSQTGGGARVPPLRRASGTAPTDPDGRFRISGLALGEYVVVAEPLPSFLSGGPAPAATYAATFYPSVVDDREAARVGASTDAATSIQIELVRIRGARVSGSVMNPSGGQTEGMRVRLYRQFGNFGGESGVAVVDARGMFEIPRVPPGWYRLSIVPRSPESPDVRTGFAEKLIEVQDRDLEDLSLVMGPGASIAGRVAVEAGASVPTAVGLRVSAQPAPEQYTASRAISATVADNWTFRMSGPPGIYRFGVAADRPPLVMTTRVTVDGAEASGSAGIDLADGPHEVVVFVALRESPKPAIDRTLPSAALVEQFKSEKTFWRQFAIAGQIVELHDASVLPSLASWLSHEDRHLRGNAAFIFGGLGDPRGFQVITEILTDESDRPEGQGIAMASSDGRYHVARQIAADRYYAAHLLGDLRDPRAIPILVQLLKDEDVRSIVPWSLGQIGDKRATAPLIGALDDMDPSMRVLAIYALETLHAKEAVPRLISLLNDQQRAHFGAQVSVADAAKAAIAKLR